MYLHSATVRDTESRLGSGGKRTPSAGSTGRGGK